MADYYDTGTVTVLSGNRAVTGTGTSWAGLIRGGDTLEIGGRQMRVASVESATSLTLKLPAPAAASGAYAIWYSAPSRVAVMQVLDDTRRLIEVSEILMAQRGDYAVRSATLNAPPATPVTGDMYVISTAPTGAWAGYAGHLARWTGTGWAFTAASPSTGAYVLGTGVRWLRGETAWGIVPGVVGTAAGTVAAGDHNHDANYARIAVALTGLGATVMASVLPGASAGVASGAAISGSFLALARIEYTTSIIVRVDTVPIGVGTWQNMSMFASNGRTDIGVWRRIA